MKSHMLDAAMSVAAVLFAGLVTTGCSLETEQQIAGSTETGVDPASCPGGAPKLVAGRPATWTVLHYSAGDNNLEKALIGDIDEMELGHQGTANVNVIVQLDKASEPGRWRYEIRPDSTPDAILSPLVDYSADEPNSGDWRELSAFGRWGVTCYPAENYVVVVSGHGGGWTSSDDFDSPLDERADHARARRRGESLRLIAPDDTNHSEIYVDELVQALGEIRAASRRPYDPDYLNRLVLYGSDACLMETVEVAYDLRNAVTYLVGSEQTEPNDGWPYNTIMRELTSTPSHYAVRPHELATMIVDAYGRSYGPGGGAANKPDVTLAAVDTSALVRARNRIAKISGLLIELMEIDAELVPILEQAREDSYTFGGDYTDLGLFLTQLRQTLVAVEKMPESGAQWSGLEAWRTLRDAIDELLLEVWPDMVLANVTGSYDGARGISIFLPTDECGWGLSSHDYVSGAFATESGWGELVSRWVTRGGAGDYQQAYGRGRMAYQAFGQAFEARLDCQLRDGELSLYMLGWQATCSGEQQACIEQLDITLQIDLQSKTVSQANLWCGQLGVQGTLGDATVSVVPEHAWTEGAFYDGRFQLAFPQPGDAAPVDVDVYFECDAFAQRSCWY